MKTPVKLLIAIALAAGPVGGAAIAQGKQQTVTWQLTTPIVLATGYRTTKVVGSNVYNEADEVIGTIDDLIVTPTDKVPFAVLSVGGFLKMGNRLVVVSSSSLEVKDKKMLLRGATKDSLMKLPAYKYAS